MNIKSIIIISAFATALQAQQPTTKPDTATPTQPANANNLFTTAPRGGAGFGGGGGGGGGYGGNYGGGIGVMGGSTSYATRLSGIVNRAGSQSPGAITVFDSRPQAQLDELNEDLTVLAHIASRNLERSFGDKTTEYRLGVPILMDNRLVQARYLDGFGVVVTVHVPFPVAPSGKTEKKPEASKSPSEWERVKASIYGGDTDNATTTNEGLRYDESLVASLKKQMLDVIRNGSNIRHMKGDEWIAVVVNGGANAEESGRNTVLALRAKKSAADASASEVTEAFEKETQSKAYLAGATAAKNDKLWTYPPVGR